MGTKESGVGDDNRARFGGGGGVRSLGDAFQPNLAMGGGSYKIPIELPPGPGGFAPELELHYDTGLGNGPFGLGWRLSLASVERRRPRAFAAAHEPEYTLGGTPLVRLEDGSYVPEISAKLQRFAFDGTAWHGRTQTLVELHFGSSPASRVEASVNGILRTERWHADRIVFPGGREVRIEYRRDGGQLYPERLRWSVFRLEFGYEPRPDPWSQFDSGFEVRTALRCTQLALHHEGLGPQTLMRTVDLTYDQAPYTRVSRLCGVALTGYRHDGAAYVPTPMAPLAFSYTAFSPEERRIERFGASVSPPPALSEDVTLVDLGGSALPGVLRLDGNGGTYWENRGELCFGPPRALRELPAGVELGDGGVRFADMEGRGSADLVVGQDHGGGYYPNDLSGGFARKRSVTLTPTFDLTEPGSYLVDLDGDRVADLLTFRNGVPLAFFNRGGVRWDGPVVLGHSGLPRFIGFDRRLRFADMTGGGGSDVVLLRSRDIVYYPYLGDGRWGALRRMEGSPDLTGLRIEDDVFVGDVNGDGIADLVVVGPSSIRLYINRAGEGYSEPIVLPRTPRVAFERVLLADMKGSGTSGLLFAAPAGYGAATTYFFLDFIQGTKPNLLSRIDNHAGLVTEVEYTSSAFERALDLREGRRWSGYLPFPVPVVKRVQLTDQATGASSVTTFRYHDGHFDGHAREYLGFAEVESLRENGAEEAPVAQRLFYHTRQTTALDSGFIAGRGQPHRTETLDAATSAILQVDEVDWEALPIAGSGAQHPAHLALERERRSRRLALDVAYESETVHFEYDAIGNVVLEARSAHWSDGDGTPHAELLRIENVYATHPLYGITGFLARTRKLDSQGALLKEFRHHYDGEARVGLPLGQVERGFKVRQVEVALTSREVDAAYGGVVPPLVTSLFAAEADADFGTLYVRELARAAVDGFGNEIETIDAEGVQRRYRFDADALFPVAVSENGGPERAIQVDPISRQVSRYEDLNGNVTRTEYDGLGYVVAVYRPGAPPGKPTEIFERVRSSVPASTTQRVRLELEADDPGYVKIDYYDGCGRVCQTRLLAEEERWAVGKQPLRSIQGRELGVQDAYFAPGPAYESSPPVGTRRTRREYDALGRVVRETLFNGRQTLHRHTSNRVEFFGPDAADRLLVDPSTPATRESVTNSAGLVVSIVERDAGQRFEVKREYDVLRRLVRVFDALGNVALENVYDLWGNIIRVSSLDAGTTTFVFGPNTREASRTDADGRSLFVLRDGRGRIEELREGSPTGSLIERYEYDSGPGANLAGRLARVEGDFGTVAYSYDASGQATEITRTVTGVAGTFVTRFAYNVRQDVTRVTTPDGANTVYEYAPTGMLRRIPGFIEAIDYGPTGLRTRIEYANGLESRRHHTPGDYLIDELLTQRMSDGAKYQHLVYTLDGVGQATRVDDLSTVTGKLRLHQNYEYDGRNRLRRASGNVTGFDFSYAYDDLGNLVENGETAQTFVYRADAVAPNRLLRRAGASGVEFEYDAAGNLTRDPELGTLHYDGRHRLVRVDRKDGAVVQYRYDHNDRRVLTRVERGGEVETRVEIEGLYVIESAGASRIVFDEERRLAVVPATGDALIHHFDRLGNVNVTSNGATGAFVGHNEYTPYGRLFVSIVIQPAYTFQGARFDDGLDLVLLGARYYRPGLARFLTADPYLLIHQDKIPALHAALNFYLYAYANPINFIDPTGEIAPLLIAIIVAAIVGAVLGAIGAAVNGAKTWEEWFLWILGGAIGAVLTVLFWYGILIWAGVAAATAAVAATVITLAGSVLGLLTPLLDESNSTAAWIFSWAIKFIKAPILTLIGLFVTLGFAIDKKRVDFRRGMIFVEVGPGNGGITLGGIVYTQSGLFNPDGTVRDDVAKHEAYHGRTVAVLGEFGFYVTYVTFGFIFAGAEGGPVTGLNAAGCGNPFEKHAYTYFNPFTFGPNPLEVDTSSC